jgi:2-polyprenyl-3-methyl-5-hydroxy-6-metoxy-1,4-benzoquinol methylase
MSDPYAIRYAVFNYGEPTPDLLQPRIGFHSVYQFPGWENRAPGWIIDIIQRFNCKDVLEIGSGANPTLPVETIRSLGLRYTANDISEEELGKADMGFESWVWDVSANPPPQHMEGRFDLVFSRMVNEHVADGRRYHANIQRLLKPGGISAHCFSTLYCLPFLVNRFMPDFSTNFLLRLFAPRDAHKTAKFRPYYSWSRGPSERMVKRFEELGYDVLSYRGYFGHGYYWRLPLLNRMEGMKARLLVSRPISALSSYGMLIVRKRA